MNRQLNLKYLLISTILINIHTYIALRTYYIGIYEVLLTDKTAYVHMQCCNSLMMLVFFEISLEVRPQIHKHKYASR